MAKFNGTLIILKIDGDELAHVQNATLNVNRELPEANDKDLTDGWSDHLADAGLKDWSVDVDGNADWSNNANVEDLWRLIDGRDAATIIFGPQSSGNMNFTGDASLNGLTLEAPNEETATLSGTLTGKGELTIIPFS